jgi:anaerobic ribonucleoside-triphosphate reductase activating protein
MTDSKAAFGLRLSRVHFPIRALGFGRRIGLWVQGCSIGCRGCMSLDTWPKDGKRTDIDNLVQEIDPWISAADGISVTGGEPLEQAEPLAAFLKALRPKLNGDVVLFTGYPIESLPGGSGEVLRYVDTLIAGAFDASLPDTRPLSGSKNQTIRFLTQLGRDRYEAFSKIAASRPGVDLVADGEGFLLAGIPRPGDLERLGDHLAAEGMALKTSAGRLGRRA